MGSRILIIRKYIFYYRKSKFRRTKKNGKECPTHGMGSLNSVMTASDRKNTDTRFNSRIQLLHLKTFLLDKGWIGVNNLPFIICGLIICFVPCSNCSPLWRRVGQEIPKFGMITDSGSGIVTDNSIHNHSVLDNDQVSSFSERTLENSDSRSGVNSSNDKLRIANKWKFENDSDFLGRKNGSFEGESVRRSKRKTLMIGDDVQNYLTTFGYIPHSDLETGNLRTEDQLRDAIRNLQSFANIPVTGELDEETVRVMRKPRCGLPDIPYHSSKRKKRYTLHGQKWHYTNLTWSLRTFQPRSLDPGQVRSELHRALDVWAKHSKLTFREINSDRADILVYFERGYHGDGYAFDGRGQILAHAFFPGGGRGGDAHFDEDEVWVLDPYADTQNGEGTSLFAVAAHEFGHSLGLSHSSAQGALMYPWYQGLPPNFELPDDDKYGIQQLYGSKKDKLWAKIPTYNPYKPYEPDESPQAPSSPPYRPRPRPTVPPPRRLPPVRPPISHPGKPNTCDTSYDAISVIRGEVFIFKDKFLWRITDHGLNKEDYPARIDRMWYGLPPNFTHIDAVYERNDKKIVFFIGKMYYVFDANNLMPGYPKPIYHLGLPRDLDHIDAAMVWGHNSKTYFFSGTMYWRFDEEVGRVELDYPRDMSMWRGVGYNIDTVFQWKDGITYFFKGKGFWKFNDLRMRVENEKQMPSAQFWMGCPPSVETEKTDDDPSLPPIEPRTSSSSSSLISNISLIFLTKFFLSVSI